MQKTYRNTFGLVLVLLLSMLALSACGGQGSEANTSALLTVTDKISDQDKLSVTAYNSLDSRKAENETWKISIDEENTWNLIEPGEMYLVDFAHDSKKKPNKDGLIEAKLISIKPASGQ